MIHLDMIHIDVLFTNHRKIMTSPKQSGNILPQKSAINP